MFIPFEQLPTNSRIWVYQSDAALTEEQEQMVNSTLREFCDQWVAHGDPLRTSFKIDRKHFIILGVDEDASAPSGCSIDTSVRMLKDLNTRIGVDFLDRSFVTFLINGQIQQIPVGELKKAFSDGTLGASTPAFHTLAPSKAVYERDWILPAGKTWLAKFLPKTTA
jgi:hypothetical protein